MNTLLIVLTGCLVQAKAVNALEVEGQVILGVFIPLTILVMTLCVGRACWDWYLTKGLDDWAYDPYLDLTLRTKYPAYAEPPRSKGQMVRSFGHQGNLSFKSRPGAQSESSLEPIMSTMALSTYKIGYAVASGRQPTSDTSYKQSDFSPEADGRFAVESRCCTHDILENSSFWNGGDLSETMKIPLHSSPHGKNSFVPLFHPAIGSPQANRAIEDTNVFQSFKHPRNPYGVPDLTCSRETLPTSYVQGLHSCDIYSTSDTTDFSSFAFTGLEPRFSTFVRVKWAQFRRRYHRICHKKTHVRLTSRDLQKDVKSNEEQTLFTISALRDQLISSQVSPLGNTTEVFELGPITQPLRDLNLSGNISSPAIPRFLKGVKRLHRKKRKSRLLKKQHESKTPFKRSKYPTSQKTQRSTFWQSKRSISEISKQLETRPAQGSVSQKQPEPSSFVLKSASNATLSDEEDYSERYLDNFDELFANAENR